MTYPMSQPLPAGAGAALVEPAREPWWLESYVGDCVGCGRPVCENAGHRAWLHTQLLYDPDAVDVDCDGTSCTDGSEHRLAEAGA